MKTSPALEANKRTDIIVMDDNVIDYGDALYCAVFDMRFVAWLIISINAPRGATGSVEVLAGDSPDALTRFTVFTSHGSVASIEIKPHIVPRYIQPVVRKRGERVTLFIDSVPTHTYSEKADVRLHTLKGFTA